MKWRTWSTETNLLRVGVFVFSHRPDEHFMVDGSLLEAWASVKSFQPKNKKSSFPPDDPGNPTVNYRGEKRSNENARSRKAIRKPNWRAKGRARRPS